MDNLILRILESPYGDFTKGSVLSQQELDTNFIRLKGAVIYSAGTADGIVTLKTYDGNNITFEATGGGVTYTNENPTTATVGGIAAGSTFSAQTMTNMWDALLYPYQTPAFTSFSLGISSPKEIGYEITTSQTFTWGTSNSSNVQSNSIVIAGYNLTTLTGLANDFSEPVTFTSSISRTSVDGPGVRTWTIQGTNTNSSTFNTSLSIRWDYKMYAGTSTNTTLTESQIEALTDYSSVKNGFTGTYNMSAGGYKYFCFADTYGTPTSFKDASNNINIALNTTYPNTDSQGNTYDLVSVTNSEGETTNYRVYRSRFILGSTIQIVIA